MDLTSEFKSSLPAKYDGTSNNYVPFIILSSARSGSTLLTSLLQSHPKVLLYGELFYPGKTVFQVPGMQLSAEMHLRVQHFKSEDPVEFLKRFIFTEYSAEVQAVGFKLFYEHASCPALNNLMQYLRGFPALRVVHLCRTNLLRQYVSLKLACETGAWTSKFGGEVNRKSHQVVVDPDRFVLYAKDKQMKIETFSDYFRSHEMVRFSYENITHDRPAILKTVLQFLGVFELQLESQVTKQETRPLVNIIGNYQELKEKLQTTEWQVFMNDK